MRISVNYKNEELRIINKTTNQINGLSQFAKHPKWYKRVLLISPGYDAYIVAPHLGLGYLAQALRRAGHEVTVLDGLREAVVYDPSKFDLVAVSAMSTYFPEACVEIKRAKDAGLLVIIGGPHVVAEPDSSLKQSGADIASFGEGDITLVEVASGAPLEKIPGIAYWKDGKIVQNPSRGFAVDIDSFGSPAWDLIDPRTYPVAPHGMIAKEWPLAPIITTRGCPYRCSYCSAPITAGGTMRYRKPSEVVDEIEMLANRFGVREIQIEDDNFTFSREHAAGVCEEILKRKIKIWWSLPNGVRIDRLDIDLLNLMKASGCYLMALGIESANQRILDMVQKKLNKEIVRKAVGDVVKSGIEAWGFFMIGFPTETKQEMVNTIEFALSLPLTRLQFTKTTPLPGTPIYEVWKNEYSNNKVIDWSMFNYYDFNPDWSGVTGGEINKLQRWGHRRFYGRPRNFLHVLKRMKPQQYALVLKRLFRLWGIRSGSTLRKPHPEFQPSASV